MFRLDFVEYILLVRKCHSLLLKLTCGNQKGKYFLRSTTVSQICNSYWHETWAKKHHEPASRDQFSLVWLADGGVTWSRITSSSSVLRCLFWILHFIFGCPIWASFTKKKKNCTLNCISIQPHHLKVEFLWLWNCEHWKLKVKIVYPQIEA